MHAERGVAANYGRRFDERSKLSNQFPGGGSLRPKYGRNIRGVVEWPYVLFYEIQPDRVVDFPNYRRPPQVDAKARPHALIPFIHTPPPSPRPPNRATSRPRQLEAFERGDLLWPNAQPNRKPTKSASTAAPVVELRPCARL